MIRSGSCAEKGPKQYMEDEHICIDDLLQYLDGIEGFPSPGAFYGVCVHFAFLGPLVQLCMKLCQ